MPTATQALRHLKDPQSWVCLLAASTFIGLGAGAFEPGEAAMTAQGGERAPAVVVAAAEPVDGSVR